MVRFLEGWNFMVDDLRSLNAEPTLSLLKNLAHRSFLAFKISILDGLFDFITGRTFSSFEPVSQSTSSAELTFSMFSIPLIEVLLFFLAEGVGLAIEIAPLSSLKINLSVEKFELKFRFLRLLPLKRNFYYIKS